ncbi:MULTISPECIES: hypothetical protein [Pseudomonas]|uniref:Uncharacterized protein n=1 Tax=Pseudomonas aphyarum TaxID=2942629 RepID=A0ABT5PKH2_9PSED|nr:hypothetical protein [Pseudomonas aphyarum]MDD0968504.1 hypothetical protein [Pseudomonas aphyarum]MDD1124404.1 hypothetical protein [Pseudomonas aphyarum]
MNPELTRKLENYIARNGETALLDLINGTLPNAEPKTLTIIANGGVHPLQDIHKRGEVFFASMGSINFENIETAESELKDILTKVAHKLKSELWSKIYIVPFGPAILSMQIKSLVYKVLNQETIDVLHAGSGVHFDISIDTRSIAISAKG